MLLIVNCLYAVVVGWRSADPRVGMLLVATATSMAITRSQERYQVDGMVLRIVAAAIVPRLLPASTLAAGLFPNTWFG